MILVIASRKDPASMNVRNQILNLHNFEETAEIFEGTPIYMARKNDEDIKLVTMKGELIHAQHIEKSFPNSNLAIFISRHSSASGTPTLSVHTPGNLGEAKLGGMSREVSCSPARAMKTVLEALTRLNEKTELNYDVSYECTHHGPSLPVPTMFTELGSSSAQWRDSKAAEVVACATMEAISHSRDPSIKAVIGIGGPHYNRKFTRIALETDLAFGHMIPKHAIPNVDLEILDQCVERTLEIVDLAILDWKGIKGSHKSKIIDLLKKLDMPFKKV